MILSLIKSTGSLMYMMWQERTNDPFAIVRKSHVRYKKHGWQGMLERLEKDWSRLHSYEHTRFYKKSEYRIWIEKNEKEIYRTEPLGFFPLISIIVPTYNTKKRYLTEMLESVLSQTYGNWELCIADDASTDRETIDTLEYYRTKHPAVKVVYRKKNGHISEASNTALSIALGDYVAFLDHDDTLSPNALYEMAKKLNEDRKLKILYSDEDKIDENSNRYMPHFKSGWNPDMFFSQNYITHLLIIKKEIIDKVGGFRKGYEGSQDYDLVLRCLDHIGKEEIGRVEKILYHWRAIKGSTAYGSNEKAYAHDAGLRGLQDYFLRKDRSISVENGLLANTYKVVYPIVEMPLVSLVVPTRDSYNILHKCIESILQKTLYENYEILIVDNESTDPKTLRYFEILKKHEHIRILEYHHPFNYSAINNYGVQYARGEIIGLLNNDVEIISSGWLSEMVQHAIRPEIGAVGAKLYYDNHTIQHAGIVLGIGGVAGHSHKYFPQNHHGYFSRLKIIQNYSAVTAACLLMRKSVYLEAGGLNEENLAVAFNDVDLCLKLQQKGYRNLWTPYSELYHHESISRGSDDTPEKTERFGREIKYMLEKWKKQLLKDPYYNRNLTRQHENFSINTESGTGKEKLKQLDKYYTEGWKNKILMSKKVKQFKKKQKKIPDAFFEIFDEADYLEVNPDVATAVERGDFLNATDHFIWFGRNEVENGGRRIGMEFPYFKEQIYLLNNPDLQKAKEYQPDFPLFWHFLEFGYEEMLKGIRPFPKALSYRYERPVLSSKIRYEIKRFSKQPLFSIVMPVYNVVPKWLKLAIESVENQWYGRWELCIADDASTSEETKAYLRKIDHHKIKIRFLKKNLGICGASNEALKLAKGEYIALMDNDDELTPDALYEILKAINTKAAELIYSDEDKIEEDGTFAEPHFKPDFSPDMFLSQNYLSHLVVIKKELVDRVGGWEAGLEGSQDYDLYLKVLEHTEKISHISKVLYHWRKVPGSTAAEYSAKSYAQEAGRKALENAMKRRAIKADVKNGKYPGTYRVKYELKEEPLVSIIIPFKDKPELLKTCIESILKKSSYQNYEIIGINNRSKEWETFKEMKRLEKRDSRVRFCEYNDTFNYSKINNFAVSSCAKGKHIVLMNNDIEIITSNWIEEMLMFSQRDDVSAVGSKLYYPNGTIQHAGIVLGIGGVAGHAHKYFSKNVPGYFSRLHIVQNLSSVTAALLMVKKAIYDEVGGLDEVNLQVAFNDVDFCLKLQKNGYLNLFTPWVEAYHHESKSRGEEDTPEKQERFKKEVEFMKNKWSKILKEGDPYYNPNLTLEREDFSVIFLRSSPENNTKEGTECIQ
ncbi:glycosyl transferase [Sulfurovum sp. NBC37-1]|nr:glycosyl transferase [Sulfurovum sp. NBC37-1]